jgi:hypothetical protein
MGERCKVSCGEMGRMEGSGCKCLSNCCSGYLVRSKPSNMSEGGIMSGRGAFCALEIVS